MSGDWAVHVMGLLSPEQQERIGLPGRLVDLQMVRVIDEVNSLERKVAEVEKQRDQLRLAVAYALPKLHRVRPVLMRHLEGPKHGRRMPYMLVGCSGCDAINDCGAATAKLEWAREVAGHPRRTAAPSPGLPEGVGERRFYIQDTSTAVGNSALWWGPDRCGYTCDLNKAGRYTEAEARAQERSRPTDRAVPCDLADSLVQRHVHVDELRRPADWAATIDLRREALDQSGRGSCG